VFPWCTRGAARADACSHGVPGVQQGLMRVMEAPEPALGAAQDSLARGVRLPRSGAPTRLRAKSWPWASGPPCSGTTARCATPASGMCPQVHHGCAVAAAGARARGLGGRRVRLVVAEMLVVSKLRTWGGECSLQRWVWGRGAGLGSGPRGVVSSYASFLVVLRVQATTCAWHGEDGKLSQGSPGFCTRKQRLTAS